MPVASYSSQMMNPSNGEDVVLKSKCENNDFSANRNRLLFSFIPSKLTFGAVVVVVVVVAIVSMRFASDD